jgi:hypothetical protein
MDGMNTTLWTILATIFGKLCMRLPTVALRQAAGFLYGRCYRNIHNPYFCGQRWYDVG